MCVVMRVGALRGDHTLPDELQRRVRRAGIRLRLRESGSLCLCAGTSDTLRSKVFEKRHRNCIEILWHVAFSAGCALIRCGRGVGYSVGTPRQSKLFGV